MSKDKCFKRLVCFVVVALTAVFVSSGFAHEQNEGDYESDGVGIPNALFLYRMSFWRAPQDANKQTIVDLAWKHGRAIYGNNNKWGDPVFYQLLGDYTIDLTSYFADYNKLPNHQDFTSVISQEPWKWPLRHPAWQFLLLIHVTNSPKLLAVDSQYFKVWSEQDLTFPPFLRRTKMTIKKGYRWDGPSLHWDGTAETARIAAKASSSMRASLVHDVFYDLMRLGLINHDTATPVRPLPTESELEGFYNRTVADCLFYMLLRQDGYDEGKAHTNFDMIREFGRKKTWPGNSDTYPGWKTYAHADAGPDQHYTCAPAGGIDVTLDSSRSTGAIKWRWRREDGTEFSTDASPVVHLAPGTHTITLSVSDVYDHPLEWDMDALVMTVSTECRMDICDLADFTSQWLSDDCNANNKFCRGLDRNGDGKLDFVDFADFAALFLNDTDPD